MPFAFNEHGEIMAANVLNSPQAIRLSVFVVRAFVRMRQELISRSALEKRLLEVERILLAHDDRIRDLYERIWPLLLPLLGSPRKQIGFHVREAGPRFSSRRSRK